MKKVNLSSPELTSVAQEFFVAAKGAVHSDPSKLLEHPYRMVDGIIFLTGSSAVRGAEKAIVTRCLKLLGPNFGRAQEVLNLAWKVARDCVVADYAAERFAKDFRTALEQQVATEWTYIAPNHLVHTREELVVGPVRVTSSQLVYQSLPSHALVDVTPGSSFEQKFKDGRIEITLPPSIWMANVMCSPGHIKEEAAWVVDVAISLLRLQYYLEDLEVGPFFPGLGDVEPSPFLFEDGEGRYLIASSGGELTLPGSAVPGRYDLDAKILEVTRSKRFKATADAIFSGDSKQLSARVKQGLGWLTRGRRTGDRAERFLFTFTAIEALLSSNDKSAPVVQTIARRAGAILFDGPNERRGFAKGKGDLYESRSGLVHRGERAIFEKDAVILQDIAEKLYAIVLRDQRLDIPFQTFQSSVDDATYGCEWEPVV